MPCIERRHDGHHGVERWFYGGEPPPELPHPPPHPGDPMPPAPERAPPPDRVREPDEARDPPVREPRPHQSGGLLPFALKQQQHTAGLLDVRW